MGQDKGKELGDSVMHNAYKSKKERKDRRIPFELIHELGLELGFGKSFSSDSFIVAVLVSAHAIHEQKSSKVWMI